MHPVPFFPRRRPLPLPPIVAAAVGLFSVAALACDPRSDPSTGFLAFAIAWVALLPVLVLERRATGDPRSLTWTGVRALAIGTTGVLSALTVAALAASTGLTGKGEGAGERVAALLEPVTPLGLLGLVVGLGLLAFVRVASPDARWARRLAAVAAPVPVFLAVAACSAAGTVIAAPLGVVFALGWLGAGPPSERFDDHLPGDPLP